MLTSHVSRVTVTDKYSVEEEFSFDNDNDSDEHSISLPESEIRPNSEEKRNKVSKSAAVKKSMVEERNKHKSHKKTLAAATCPECGKVFANKHILKTHMNNIHSETKQASIPCSKCGKAFANKYVQKTHEKIACLENQDRPKKKSSQKITSNSEKVVCNECPKTFKNKYNLKYHFDRSHGGLTFLCSECPESFSKKKRLEKHLYIAHNKRLNNKLHNCDECGKDFFFKAEFSNHTKLHQRHPDLLCKMCDKSFSSPFAMRKHVKLVHDKVKDFCCNQCGSQFGRKDKLKIHIKNLHSNMSQNFENEKEFLKTLITEL